MYGNPRARIATARELLESMDRCAIDRSVILGFAWTDPRTCSRHNDYLLEAAVRSGGGLIPFCTVQPAAGVDALAAEVERCVRGGARGLGELRPDDQGFRLLDTAEGEALSRHAIEHDLVLLFHVTEPAG